MAERSNVGAVEAGYLQGDQQGGEVTSGYEMFGLELGWEEERRLGDSRKNKQPMTYVEATGGGTQKNGNLDYMLTVHHKVSHYKTSY